MVKKFLTGLVVFILASAAGAQAYQPTKASLRSHPVPEWYNDAKFGIFIHWGLFSVPAYAPVEEWLKWKEKREGGSVAQYKLNPYAEWYQNSLRIEGSAVRKYHRQTYGENFSYDDFAPIFNEEIKQWDPKAWADLFSAAGARYTVLVTKHHDGFLLWPSARPSPKKPGWMANRDIVGELAEAVRARDIRFGAYYSGGLDWTFQDQPISDRASFITNRPTTKEYADYVEAHFQELIDRYQPSVLWNDISYPSAGNPYAVVAYYYNSSSDAVIDDRWRQDPNSPMFLQWPIRQIINWAGDKLQRGGMDAPKPLIGDFSTPEYETFEEYQEQKWEACRGVGFSFGYNRTETADQYLQAPEAIRLLIDVVSKNGNLLLNVGPRADGSISQEQVDCLLGMGAWLKANGDAIYGTKPWSRAEGVTTSGLEVRFTSKGGKLYAIVMGANGGELIVKNLAVGPQAQVMLLETGKAVEFKQQGTDLKVILPDGLETSPARVLVIN